MRRSGKLDILQQGWRRNSSVAAMVVIGLCLGARPGTAAIEPDGTGAMSRPDIAKLMSQAATAMKGRHPEVAAIYLKNAETLAPNDATINFALGQALLATGNATAAEREFRSARLHGMSDDKVLPQIYDSILAENLAQKLLDEFADPAATDQSGLAADTLRARAFALQQLKQIDQAGSSMDRALAISRSPQNLASRAQIAHNAGDDDLAMKLTDEALGKDPSNASALTFKISLLQFAKQPGQAVNFANTLVRVTNNDPLSLLIRAGVYMQSNQDAKALPDINAILRATPTLSQAIFLKSEILAKKKDIKGAWNLAQTLPAGFLRTRDDVAVAVGQMAIDAGHREIATNIFDAAVQAFPNSVDARLNLAFDYLALNEDSNALKTLAPLQDGSDPRVMTLLGQVYQKEHNTSEALKYFQKAKVAGAAAAGSNQPAATAPANARPASLDDAAKQLSAQFEKQPSDPTVAGPLVAILIRQGNMDAAGKIAERLSSTAPKSPYGPLYWGEILAQKGQVDAAVSAFSDAIARDPKFIPAKFDRAVILSGRGDIPAASADLQSILATDPKNAPAALKLAQISVQTGQPAKALPLLKQAATSNPKDIVSNLALADYYMSQKRPADASAVITAFLKLTPKDPGAIAMQGNIQLASGATDQAIATFRGLSDANPKSSQIAALLAGALAKKGDVAGATAAYQKAIAINPTNSSAHSDLIYYLFAIKNNAAAIAAAQDYATKQPGPLSAQMLASSYVNVFKYDDAENVLTKSQAQNPDSATVRAIAGLMRRRGAAKKADDLSTAWLSRHPEDVDVRNAYAAAQMTVNPAIAEQQFNIVLNTHPDSIFALNDLAGLLAEKNPAKALPYAQKAQKLAPTLPAVLDTLGWVKWQTNDHPGAAVLLRQAYAGDKNPEIVYHLAVALNGTGQQAEAKKMLTMLQAYSGDFDDKKKALALLASMK